MCEFSPQHHPSILDHTLFTCDLGCNLLPSPTGWDQKNIWQWKGIFIYTSKTIDFLCFKRFQPLLQVTLNLFQRSFPFLVSKSRRLPGLPLLLRPLCFLCTCRLCCRSQSCWRSSGRSGRLRGVRRCLWREVRGCIEKVTGGWLLGLRIPLGLDISCQPTWRKQVDKWWHEILNSECETEYWKYVKTYVMTVMILFMWSIMVI